jgi:LuxR family maltose regulon positive regulatory protein
MATPLLQTKLYIPPPRPELVPRPRLVERIDAGIHSGHKLTLVSASAGFGKTTLLSAWVAGCGQLEPPIPVAWLSLDQEDNDPIHFLAYTIAALQTVHPGLGQAVLTVLYASQPQPAPVEASLTILINEIAGMGEPVVLVLDDYHAIRSQAVDKLLGFLLDHLPPQMHLVISSRRDPAFPLSRLQARGEMTEIRAADLRFTRDEIALFLNQVMGLNLSAQNLAALETRTEGWISGLRLTALSMRRLQDTTEFIQKFTGSNRYIVDYLGEEVLQQQDERVQTFLRETSILRRLSAPVCDRVTGQSGSQGILEQLETANLFIVPLDDRRDWYRYHHLFTDFLQHQLERYQPERVPALHHRASEWYEENGPMGEAVFHALAAKRGERAADLVETNALETLMRGQVYTVANWLDRLPPDSIRSRPKLGIAQAWQFISTGQIEKAEAWLQMVEEKTGFTRYDGLDKIGQGSAEANELQGGIATIRSTISAWRGETWQTIEISQWALERFPSGNPLYRSILAWNLAFASRIAGDINTAERAYKSAIKDAQASGNYMIALTATEGLAELYSVMGQLQKAEKTFLRVFQLGDQYQMAYSVAFGAAHIGLADLMYQWNRLDAAVEHLQQGFEICERWGALDLVKAHVCLARIKMAQSDAIAAMEAVQKAIDLAQEHNQRFRGGVAVALRTGLWLALGEIVQAERWAQERDEYDENDLGELNELEGIVLARLLLALGEQGKALVLLDKLLHNAQLVKRMGSAIEILILQSTAWQSQSNLGQATACLERALVLAEREGFVQVFLEQRPAIDGLLNRAIKKRLPHSRYARLVVGSQSSPIPPSLQQDGLVEPLSEREMEVLRLVTKGHSNREIGERLVITTGTVKRHITNIYGKLGVHSRTQAIALARELDILP